MWRQVAPVRPTPRSPAGSLRRSGAKDERGPPSLAQHAIYHGPGQFICVDHPQRLITRRARFESRRLGCDKPARGLPGPELRPLLEVAKELKEPGAQGSRIATGLDFDQKDVNRRVTRAPFDNEVWPR